MTTLSQDLKNEKGFSLLELLLVVAVGAVLILAGLAAYRLVTENNNVNDSIRLLNTLKQQIQRAYQSEGTYNGDIDATLKDLRAYPAGTLQAGGQARHPFGGRVTYAANSSTFSIIFGNIERSACIQLGQLYNSSTDSDFVSLDINGNGNPDANGDANGIIDLSELQSDCPAANAGGVPMTWTFY